MIELFLFFLLVTAVRIPCNVASSKKDKTNFLFILYDDLRPELSIYGQTGMITPNFERLARRSVVFDYAFCQIAVCNPSRDSLLTGLRPDSVGTYGFQWSFRPNVAIPALMRDAGYKTAGYGKVLHWDGPDPEIWSEEQWDGDWYDYQNKEQGYMNASTQPDKTRPVDEFRDYMFTTKAINMMTKLHKMEKLFMIGLGFKLPHLQVHVPFKYFDMYRNRTDMWRRKSRELRYPATSPIVGHKCCGWQNFAFMNKEGALPSVKKVNIGPVNTQFTQQMYTELMWGYAAAVTFLDAQIGRLLDAIDEMKLWNNITIVLTSDHGMHNGEKGIWEKWTLFDESTRVPLMISHPDSIYQGQHYTHPVELIDIFPTIIDMFGLYPSKPCLSVGGNSRCYGIQGKSLAPVVLGDHSTTPSSIYNKRAHLSALGKNDISKAEIEAARSKHHKHKHSHLNAKMPTLSRSFAVSQSWRCAPKDLLKRRNEKPDEGRNDISPWFECNRAESKDPAMRDSQVSVMGYSFRSAEFRYTLWLHFDRVKNIPEYGAPPYAEELYDHRGEMLSNFTHMELVNVVKHPDYLTIAQNLKAKALHFIQHEVVFHGPYDN